ncbi:MAG: hypothetical protein GY716_16510 [bacterium]|nr:hypothetical protein [bacterium]
MNKSYRSIVVAFLTFALLALPLSAQVKNHNDIKYPELPAFQIDKPEVYDLKNGMKVFLIENHELPLISVSARVRTGSNYEPAKKTGLGGVFGQVQREGGTTSMTGDEMDDFLEARAASVETSMGGDSGFASMNCLAEDFDEIFAVFADVMRNPAFAEDKLELAKVQSNSGIARRNDNAQGVAGREFNRLIYGADSPLSRLTEYETVAAIERGDLVAWHKKYYHPNNVYLGIVGDFDSAEMKRQIESTLGDWAKGPAFDEGDVAFTEPEPGVYFIEKEDVTQAFIQTGHLGIRRDNPDYFAVTVMNEVLSGGFSGRLMQNIRTDKGLAYGVGGGIGSSYMRPGVFGVSMSTKSTTMAESVDALREEIVGIIENPATAEEILQAKETILNSFVFNYDSKGKILNQQMLYAFYGMPSDYLETYQDNIGQVSTEDVARVAKKYIHPDQMALLVVGKSAEFDRPMNSFGSVKTIDITIPDPPDTGPVVTRNAETLEAGSKLFALAANRMMGQEPGRVESVRLKSKRTMSMQGQKISIGMEITLHLPDKMHVAVNTPMGVQTIVINGDEGTMSMGGRSQPLPASQIEESTKDLDREVFLMANSLGHEGLEAVLAGTEEIDGTSCEVVAINFRGTESTLCVAEDGRVLKQTYQGKHPFMGNPGQMEVYFSDYRDVGNYNMPFKQVQMFNGEELSSSEVEDVSVNPSLDVALFDVGSGASD